MTMPNGIEPEFTICFCQTSLSLAQFLAESDAHAQDSRQRNGSFKCCEGLSEPTLELLAGRRQLSPVGSEKC
jgi:hypothetical protein